MTSIIKEIVSLGTCNTLYKILSCKKILWSRKFWWTLLMTNPRKNMAKKIINHNLQKKVKEESHSDWKKRFLIIPSFIEICQRYKQSSHSTSEHRGWQKMMQTSGKVVDLFLTWWPWRCSVKVETRCFLWSNRKEEVQVAITEWFLWQVPHENCEK